MDELGEEIDHKWILAETLKALLPRVIRIGAQRSFVSRGALALSYN
jgi:hypothetical protein